MCVLCVVRRLNARVGDEVVEDVVGRHRVPRRYEKWRKNDRTMCREKKKYIWMKQDNGMIVNRAMIDNVVVLRNIIGQLLDVSVLRGEGGGISNHFRVEGKLRIGMRWVKTRRVGKAMRVLKVSELNRKEKMEE